MNSCDTSPAMSGCNDDNISLSTSSSIAEAALLNSSQEVDEDHSLSEFVVPDMHCISCIRKLENTVGKLPFVTRVRANLSMKKISVTWQKGPGHIVEIDRAITDTGFDHSTFDLSLDDGDQANGSSKKLLTALAVAGFAAVNIMLLSISVWSGADKETAKLFHLISGLIAVPAVFYCGQPFFRSAISALKVKRLNMDVPISLAVLLALAMSIYESIVGGRQAYFDAAVTLLFFLLIGRYLDNLMREKARSSLVQLARLSAKGATIIDENAQLFYCKLNQIQPGMIMRVMAGERVGVDGEVIRGRSDVDRSVVTGESVPQMVEKGSDIEAGTLNLTGAIDIRVIRDASHSFLAEVTRMMEVAEKGRGHFTRIADRMAQIYAPAVHALAALAFVGWMIATDGQWHTSIYVAISVLIITCPCALGLAVPVVHVIGARQLLKNGILIRDGSGLERLEQVDHVIFDKTGTLTHGLPSVISANFASNKDKAIAKALASHSSHPYSMAVAGFIKQPASQSLSDVIEIAGAGVEGKIDGRKVRLGRVQWVGEIAKDDNHRHWGELGFAIAEEKIIRFELCEVVREDACEAIEALKNTKLNLEILSGDHIDAVKKIADQLDITNYSHGLKPADKISRIDELKTKGLHPLMVGDGLNDSPSLAAAHVSIAPVNASDICRHAADFVFTRPSLLAVPIAIRIAHQTGRLVRQNFALAIAYNSLAIPFAMAGYVTPLIAAIAMSASSIVVVANSMRLNFGDQYQPLTTARTRLLPLSTSDANADLPHNPSPDAHINQIKERCA